MRPLVDIAGAALTGSQMPFTQLLDAHSAGVVQLPPFGTPVFVGVADGVVVEVAVPVGVLVAVAVGGHGGGSTGIWQAAPTQVPMQWNTLPCASHSVWLAPEQLPGLRQQEATAGLPQPNAADNPIQHTIKDRRHIPQSDLRMCSSVAQRAPPISRLRRGRLPLVLAHGGATPAASRWDPVGPISDEYYALFADMAEVLAGTPTYDAVSEFPGYGF
jgi:hypothetical protein